MKFVGSGDARFGTSPLLHAAMSARQLDADKFMARDDTDAVVPARLYGKRGESDPLYAYVPRGK